MKWNGRILTVMGVDALSRFRLVCRDPASRELPVPYSDARSGNAPIMIFPSYSKLALVAAFAALLSACGSPQAVTQMPKPDDPRYAEVVDEGNVIAAVNSGYLTERTTRTDVAYAAADAPGTIVVDPFARFLYLVQPGNRAVRYGIAVGREGYGFSGDAAIHRKEAWPRWTPTANMVRKDPGLWPLCGWHGGWHRQPARRSCALYLYRGGRDTYYRIHGTNNASTIGRATSAGCIRLYNQDAINLFDQVDLGTYVHVRTFVESQALEGELVEDANGFMQPITAFPEDVQASIRAGIIPWPKFVPVIGVNATAPIMPPTADGSVPPAPGT